MELLNFFPFDEIRSNQKWLMEKIKENIDKKEIKYVVYEAPTGTGKTGINYTLAKYYTSNATSIVATTVTASKGLMDQILKDFSDHAELRGRQNYDCERGGKVRGKACKDWTKGKGTCNMCTYGTAVDKYFNNQLRVANIHLALLKKTLFEEKIFEEGVDPDDLEIADHYLFVDEAHNFITIVTDCLSLQFDKNQLRQFGILRSREPFPDYKGKKDYQPFIDKIKKRIEYIKEVLQAEDPKDGDLSPPHTLSEYLKASELDREEMLRQGSKAFNESALLLRDTADIDVEEAHFENFIENMSENLTTTPSIDNDNYILSKSYTEDLGEKELISVTFKPIIISSLIAKFLKKFKKVVFCSATILDFDMFTSILGLPDDSTAIFKSESIFPPERSPMYMNQNVGPLNKNNLDQKLPEILKRVDYILGHYSKFKGVVHTHTYKIARFLWEYSCHRDRILFPENAGKLQSCLQNHIESDLPTVIISPSVYEGLDLKDDLARFQILVKVPWPYMADPLVGARNDVYPGYIEYLTALKIEQAKGRSSRSETDWSHNFMIDGSFTSFFRNNSYLFSKHFKDSFRLT